MARGGVRRGGCGDELRMGAHERARGDRARFRVCARRFARRGDVRRVGAVLWRRGWRGWRCCALLSACAGARLQGLIETAGGALYIGLPPAVFLWLRDRAPEGCETILALFAIIWAADIFAYFGGKLIGGPEDRQRALAEQDLVGHRRWSAGRRGRGLRLRRSVSRPILRCAWHGSASARWLRFTGLMGDLVRILSQAPVRREGRKPAHSRSRRRARPHRQPDGRDAAGGRGARVCARRDARCCSGRGL